MKLKKFKFYGIFICFAMLLSTLCLFNVKQINIVKAEEIEPYVYNLLKDGTYSIGANSKYKQSLTEIVLPSEYNGAMITEVSANGFILCNNLKKICIPRTITKINNSAFAFCKNLEYVGMSQTIEIGQNAFASCPKLESLVIPKTIQNIGNSAFKNNNSTIYIRKAEIECSFDSNWQASANLEVVYDYEGIEYSEIYDDSGEIFGYSLDNAQISEPSADILVLDMYNGKPILNIGYGAFFNAGFNTVRLQPVGHSMNVSSFAFLQSYIMQIECYNDITFFNAMDSNEISDSVFSESPFLQKVILPKNMTELGIGIFSNCTNLMEVSTFSEHYKLPNIKKIGADAFSGCTNINKIIIPQSVFENDNVNLDNAVFEEWKFPQTIYFEFEKPQDIDIKYILGLDREYANNDASMPLILWNKQQFRVDFYDENEICLLCSYLDKNSSLETIFETNEYKEILNNYNYDIVWYDKNEENIFSSTSIIDDNISLYLHEAKKYTITYYVDGEIDETLMPNSYNTEIDVFLPWLEEEGKTFYGWYLNKNYQDIRYGKIDKHSFAKDLVLYGKFENNNYKVRLNYNDNTSNFGEEEVTYLKPHDFKVPTRSGYDFEGWADESGNMITDKDGQTLKSWSIPYDTTLYAVWSQYVITADYSGARTHIIKTISRSEESSGEKSLKSIFEVPQLASSDFEFGGWYLDPACETLLPSSLNGLDKIINGSKSITVYAKLQVYGVDKLVIVPNMYSRIFLDETNENVALFINDGAQLNSIYLDNFTSIQSENRPVIDIRGADTNISIICNGNCVFVGGNGVDYSDIAINGSSAIVTEGREINFIHNDNGIVKFIGGNGGNGHVGGKGGDALNSRIITKIRYNSNNINNNNVNGKLQFIGGDGGCGSGGGRGGDGGCGIKINNYITKDSMDYYEYTLLDILGYNNELEILGGNGGNSMLGDNGIPDLLIASGGNGGDGIQFNSDTPQTTESLNEQYGLFIKSKKIIIKGGNGGDITSKNVIFEGLRRCCGGYAIYAHGNDITIGGEVELYGGDAGMNLYYKIDGGTAIEGRRLWVGDDKCSIYGGRGSSGQTLNCGNGGCPAILEEINSYDASCNVTLYGGKGGIDVDGGVGGVAYRFTEENKIPGANNYINGNSW